LIAIIVQKKLSNPSAKPVIAWSATSIFSTCTFFIKCSPEQYNIDEKIIADKAKSLQK
jgi:hypothetical protein